jgi:predicted helicase
MDHFFCADKIVETKCGESTTQSCIFPLFTYGNGVKKPNINSKLIEELKRYYQIEISAEQIFYYIYAIVYSNKYRERYSIMLQIDYPRIPFTPNYKLFVQLCQLGKELTDLHLMKKQFPPTIKYEIIGSNRVESIKYTEGKLFINKTQFFDNIPEAVWNFRIGGYPVLDKWIKYRKNRELSVQEILHVIQIVEVLKETIQIMDEIDKLNFLPE